MANTNDVFEAGMESAIDDIDLLVGAAEEAKASEESSMFWKGVGLLGCLFVAGGAIGYAIGNALGYKEGYKNGTEFDPTTKK